MKYHRSPRTLRDAFSVMELLIASVIIAVLLAIALPTVHTMRERALSTHCIRNLRQIGMAALAHSQERNGRLPDMGLYNSHRPSEAQYSLLPYLGYPLDGNRYEHPTVFTCPIAWKRAPTKTPTYRTYAINRYACSSRVNQPHDFDKIKDGIPQRFQNVSAPAKMAFFMEGYHRGEGEESTYFIDQNYERLRPGTTLFLHGDAIHAVFMDGHVEPIQASYALAELTERSSTTHPFWGSSR